MSLPEWRLPVPYRRPPLSLNSRITVHAARNRIVQEVKHAGWVMARHHKVPPLQAIIVELVWFKGDNRRADADNMAPTLKALQDGLVKANVVPDDSGDRVISARLSVVLKSQDPYPGAGARMELRVRDASALAPII
jgi:crossover junction endodeoxyribonuclease RusA